MNGKLGQFQKGVRPGQEEVAAKALKKALNANSWVFYSISLVSFLNNLLPGFTLGHSAGSIFVGFIFRGFLWPTKSKSIENFINENLYLYSTSSM